MTFKLPKGVLKKISSKMRRKMQYFLSGKTPRTMLGIFDGDDLLIEGPQDIVKKEQRNTASNNPEPSH